MDDSPLTFAQLRAEVFRLYHMGDWPGALRLIASQPGAASAPSETARVIFWQACFLALLGRGDQAVAVLEAGLRRGCWWSEASLRGDPDLASLQEHPALAAIVAESARRNAAAEASSARQIRPLVAAPPPDTPQPYPALLALHGYGGSADETLPFYAPLAARGWLAAALASSQQAGMDGYHWGDEARAIAEVGAQLQALAQTYPLDLTRLVVAGFSNGGRTALLLALTGAIPARLAVSVGGGLRDETLTALDWAALNNPNQPRLLLLVGERDAPVRERLIQQAERLRAAGLAVELTVVSALGHDIPADYADRLAAALAGLG